MNHKKFRALLKKFRRKFKRQALAKLREQKGRVLIMLLKIISCKNQKAYYIIEMIQRLLQTTQERQHMLWLEREKEAQELFEKQKDLRELQKKREEEIRLLMVIILEKVKFITHTMIMLLIFRCSRSHPKPEISHTLLIKGMYSHFSIEQSNCDDYDADCNLEYEDSETYHHFCEFYDDVLPEFKKAGKVIQFKVCCNHEPHLRGNVYVQYSKQEEAEKAFRLFNTRWYGGKQLSCEFTNVIKWKSAICGLFHRNRCPKGSSCNFLHVFRNPDNEFWAADRDLEERRSGYRSERRNYSHRSPENRSDRRRRKKRRRRSASSYDRHLGSSPSDASSNSSRSPSPSRSRKRSSRRHSRKSSKSKKKRRH
ncbi:U2 small nuclear ribonucleoprotein auxiliary factor 35 kDa subunit-related protein 2-like [Centruroides sculpturatus]|uniref:U2 small nuclear ribonucleoprotein auxiliary factor 35 kDa subunit-related protein 2-like n=1 Tax=Centruroides sculpturatus TaxID=218467 RepID=UPI000C6DE29C|nr:U2 small nuclear ribonucleoprotein auxiliary factor 35 kDa subunit-related protein 2-like [Centruroides sculpturatus]